MPLKETREQTDNRGDHLNRVLIAKGKATKDKAAEWVEFRKDIATTIES